MPTRERKRRKKVVSKQDALDQGLLYNLLHTPTMDFLQLTMLESDSDDEDFLDYLLMKDAARDADDAAIAIALQNEITRLKRKIDYTPKVFTKGEASFYRPIEAGGLPEGEVEERLSLNRENISRVCGILFAALSQIPIGESIILPNMVEVDSENLRLVSRVTVPVKIGFMMLLRRIKLGVDWGTISREFDYDRSTCSNACNAVLEILKADKWLDALRVGVKNEAFVNDTAEGEGSVIMMKKAV